jgi:hypothetical protein
VTSLSCHQSWVWTDYIGDITTQLIVPSSTALAFLTNVNENRKSASPSPIEVTEW